MVSKTTVMIENKLKEERVKNIKYIMDNPTDASSKIKNHVERFDGVLEYDEIMARLKTDTVIASFFAKDPAKQNNTEIWVANMIKENISVKNFSILSKGGTDSVRIGVDGNMIFGDSKELSTKSVDFKFEIGNETFLCTQKFTRGRGGSQDNQKKDVIEFLRYGSRVMKDKTVFVAILDGDYFDEKELSSINSMFKQYKNVFATSADMFIYK